MAILLLFLTNQITYLLKHPSLGAVSNLGGLTHRSSINNLGLSLRPLSSLVYINNLSLALVTLSQVGNLFSDGIEETAQTLITAQDGTHSVIVGNR